MNRENLFSVTRERLNANGYTSAGRYFGVGAPLYRWSAEVLYTPRDGRKPYTEYTEGWQRAASREEVKAYLRRLYPGARFHR